MSRSLFVSLIIAGVVGCQGQSNPFMRTTVPPPATGAGAPTDPYYNNTGPAQSATASPSAAVPAPVNAQPVVPPPDKRFSQPGGFNFPQGSVLHRKAVDPTPDAYRTGVSTIARAARPRSMLGGEQALAATEPAAASAESELTPESAPEIVQASAEENSSEAPLAAAAAESAGAPRELAVEAGAGDQIEELTVEQEPQVANSGEPQPEIAIESNPGHATMQVTAAGQGTATLRIVSAENGSSSAEESSVAETMPNDARSPFVAVSKPSTSLTVAPPMAASTAPSEATIARTAGASTGETASRARFYFDRNEDLYPAQAQPVAYVGNPATGVEFAGGSAGNGGLTGGPEGTSAYAYHTQYQWLRGKLEYSSAANRWKLRYIPIDGATDQFGGSVVLPSSPLLDSMRAGEMVTARGEIGDSPAEHGRFAPRYQLSSLERQ